MREVVIGEAASFPQSGRKVVEIGGSAVGVFRVGDKFVAYENVCPHMGGPVCQGKIIPRVEELVRSDKTTLGLSFSKSQTNIVCPWHGYEFDIATGQHQGNPRMRLRPVKVEVVEGDLIVTLPEGTHDRIRRSRPQRASDAR
jgi:nitrite reductase/ring-hydroxylating ferredoxin subunit